MTNRLYDGRRVDALAEWWEVEKRALTGDKIAIGKLVSEIRRYRAAAEAVHKLGFRDELDKQAALELMTEAHETALLMVLPEEIY